jgi:hypothetical protein
VYRNGVQIFGGTPELETCVKNSKASLICSSTTVVLLGIAGCRGGGSGNTMSLSVDDRTLDGAEKMVVLFGIPRNRERLSKVVPPVTIIYPIDFFPLPEDAI